MNLYDLNAMLSSRYSLRDLTATSKMLSQPNMPESPDHYDNLVYLADMLEQLESEIGPFLVLSSYRTSELQSALASAGEPVGAGKSFHELGRAVDISPTTMSITEFFGRLLANENLKNRFAEIAIKPSQNALHLSINTPNDERTTKVLGLNSEGVYAKLGVEDLTNYIAPYMESDEVAYDYASSRLVTYNRWPLIIGAGAALLGILIIIKGFSDSGSRRVLRLNPRKTKTVKPLKRRKKMLTLGNPVTEDSAPKYFQEVIDESIAENSQTNKTLAGIQTLISSEVFAVTQRDDQVKFLIQLKRLNMFAFEASENLFKDKVDYAQSLLRVIANDLQKFLHSRTVKRARTTSSGIAFLSPKSVLVEASKDANYLEEARFAVRETLRDIITMTENFQNEAHHYLELMTDNINFKDLAKISWNRKPDELFRLLRTKHDIITDEMAGKVLLTAVPEANSDFLVINKNLKWVKIHSNFCPYEQEVMGHCATAPRGSFLLSLREYSKLVPRYNSSTDKWTNIDIKTPTWLPRVTATVQEIQKVGSVTRYRVSEILGPKNQKVNPKWYQSIKALLNSPDIIEEDARNNNSFTSRDLTPEDQEALYKKKPDIAPASWVIEKASDKELGGLFLKFLDKSYEPDFIKASLASLYYETAETVCLFKFKDTEMFFERISDFLSKKHGDVLKGIVEAYTQPWTWTESMDFSSQWHNSSMDEFIAEMSDTQFRKAFGNIKRNSYTRQDISADLGDIINQVIRDVSEDSYANAISRTALAVLKDATFQDVGERETAYINFHKGEWKFLISTEALRYSLITSIDREEPLTHYMLSNFSISRPEDWNIPSEFDEAAALEKFKELVLEMYGP